MKYLFLSSLMKYFENYVEIFFHVVARLKLLIPLLKRYQRGGGVVGVGDARGYWVNKLHSICRVVCQ